jgi:hypothetical protein
MRCVGVAELPEQRMCRGGCAYEVKFDGWRCLAFVEPDGVYLQSRRAKDLTPYFPHPQKFHRMGPPSHLTGICGGHCCPVPLIMRHGQAADLRCLR